MAVGEDNITVARGQMDAVAAAADEQAGQRRLHGAFQADTVGVGVLADDFHVTDGRQSLLEPDLLLEVRWLGGTAMSADEVDGRAGAAHQETRSSTEPSDAEPAMLIERDEERFADDVVAARKEDVAAAALDGVL